MACKAAAPEVGDPLFRGGGRVRIVTGGTGKTVAALSLALALQECFPLAGRPSLRTQFSRVDKVSYEIGKILAGHECSERAAGGVDRSLAFQVTLQTNRVTLFGR